MRGRSLTERLRKCLSGRCWGKGNGLPKEDFHIESSHACSENRIKSGLHVGIDGCRGKWVAVAISDDNFEVGKFATIDEICSKYDKTDTMIIDIPIGLPESTADIRPDRAVRKQLGRKGSSIFDTPCRQAVYAESKGLARAYNIKTWAGACPSKALP